MKKILIIGQGIAGTVLAWTLQRMGAQVWVMDAPGVDQSASQVAAGIINPVTGKRFAKSWMFETLYPFAKTVYLQMEQDLQVQLWQDLIIERMLESPEELNNWSLRYQTSEFSDFLHDAHPEAAWMPFTQNNHFFGKINQAARVHFQILLPVFRQNLEQNGRLLENWMDYSEVQELSTQYDALIFCEGYRGASNPFFQHLGWNITKGEALHICLDTALEGPQSEVLKKSVLVSPYFDGKYWVGSTNDWTFKDALPSASGRAKLEKGLKEMLKSPYIVEAHKTAIRPTVKDRRPFLGMHSKQHKIGIFNGLGTKGALLAPFWAHHFAQHLLQGTPLDPQVDINRFDS